MPVYRKLISFIEAGALHHPSVLRKIHDDDDKLQTIEPNGRILSPGEFQAQEMKRLKDRSSFAVACYEFLPNLFRIKSPAFSEESEWRIIPRDIPRGLNLDYRGVGGRIIPYHNLKLLDLSLPIINQVIVGPKHETPLYVIQNMLASSGFYDVAVTKSASSYR